MSKELLDRAYDLIIYEKYDEARNILEGLKDRSSTARRWLANLPGSSEPEETEPEPLLDVPEVTTVSDDEPEDNEPEMESVAGAELSDLEQERELRFDDPETPPMVAESMPMDDELPAETTPTDDLMPIDETADVLPTEDFVPTSGNTRWEYREIVLKDWHQHISNIEYALEQGGEKITIEDAYTKLLNESGAQGWEVVSEEVLPQQYVRLLMKRLVQS